MEIEIINQDQYDLLPRIYHIINRLSEDQQLQLLRRLLADNLKTFLFKAVIDLPEVERSRLLSFLDQNPERTEAIKTVNIDDDNVSMRGHLRKRCLISAQFSFDQHSYRGYILDISTEGLFIETDAPTPIGQGLTIRFSLPAEKNPLELKGHVIWLASNGVGIQLDAVSSKLEAQIRHFVGTQ